MESIAPENKLLNIFPHYQGIAILFYFIFSYETKRMKHLNTHNVEEIYFTQLRSIEDNVCMLLRETLYVI